MKPIKCSGCGEEFTPKALGFNAKYCCGTCKTRARREAMKLKNPEKVQVLRARSYQATKRHPDRMAKHRASGRTSAQKTREWLSAYKLSIGCVDCGYREHAAALQLDHEGPKAVEIAEARSSVARLKAEIESGQCRVRCANCHSVKTWERKQVKP